MPWHTEQSSRKSEAVSSAAGNGVSNSVMLTNTMKGDTNLLMNDLRVVGESKKEDSDGYA
jgi:hypothetical protein